MKKILKIVLGIMFIPLILGTAIAIFDLAKDGIEYVVTAIVIEIISIWGYYKLNQKIDNIEIKNNIKEIVIQGIKERQKNKELQKIEKNKWKKVVSDFYISEEYQKLRINKKEIRFDSIIDVDLIEEGTTESKTIGENITKGESKKHVSPIKGLVGFGIAGPVGAIIGGTSGKTDIKNKMKVNTITKNIDYCTNLSVKITLKDVNNPMIIYKLIDLKINKNGFLYKASYENAQKCVAIIQVIISNNKQFNKLLKNSCFL